MNPRQSSRSPWGAILLFGLGSLLMGGSAAWNFSAEVYEEIQSRQLTRLLQDELIHLLESQRYAAVPALFERFHRSRQLRTLAWCDRQGKVREKRGPLPEDFLPPAQPRVDQTPGGNQRTWSQLPPAPGQKVSDWLYLELDTLAPGWRGAMVGLALAFLGLIWLRRPPVRDLASSAEVKSREVPACSEAPAKPDASSSSEDSSSMP